MAVTNIRRFPRSCSGEISAPPEDEEPPGARQGQEHTQTSKVRKGLLSKKEGEGIGAYGNDGNDETDVYGCAPGQPLDEEDLVDSDAENTQDKGPDGIAR